MPSIVRPVNLKCRTLQLSRILHSSLFLLCCFGAAYPSRAQSVPPASPQSTQSGSQQMHDPHRPEQQPHLDVERDPVFSPEGDLAPAPPPPVVTGKGQPAAGEIAQKAENGVYTLYRNVNEVLLNCTVVDEKGHVVTDLDRADFHVWEDSTPQTITSFRHQDLPVSLGIVLDSSGSMREKRGVVNAATLALMRASNPQDTAFVVNFSDDAYLDQDFTSDIHALERGLMRVATSGGTAMYDAVAASAAELAGHATHPKQVLLIVTDGDDNASRLNLRQAIRRVQGLGGPVVYTIGLLFDNDESKQQVREAHDALDALSNETGGLAYFSHTVGDVNEIALEVARDIRNQYTVGYHSTKPASERGYRTVHVEVKSPKHGRLIVRTRNGYYPGQESSPSNTAAAGTPQQAAPARQ